MAGKYSDGKVILDRPVDWPDGTSVQVLGPTTAAGIDVCVDGSSVNDTRAALDEWIAWFDSQSPVFTADAVAQFEEDLRQMREEQGQLLTHWQQRMNHLAE
jgi:hypothetical protein